MAAPIIEHELLAPLPEKLRDELLSAYSQIAQNFRERRWEPSELNGGKLCEVVFSILDGLVKGKFPSRSSKPKNMVEACRGLEKAPASFPRSVRVQIPRILMGLYEIRNNRGVGHVGGDVDPNHMDAMCVLAMSKWLLSELVRLFHNVETDVASAAVDRLVERIIPTIWKVGSNLRVLDTSMSMIDRALVLLYHQGGSVKDSDLMKWIEHSNVSVFRRDVLRRGHKEKLIEYDLTAQSVEISPLGIARVEDEILREPN
jgi:hypothetical protein